MSTVRPIHSTFGEDSPRVRRSDPITSSEAADKNDVGTPRAIVLDVLTERGAMADHELVAVLEHLPFTPQRIRTARHELTDFGLVEFAGYFHLTPSGNKARVWAVVDERTAA